jgi:hypothetical protein
MEEHMESEERRRGLSRKRRISRPTCFVGGVAVGMIAQPLLPIIAAGAVLSVATTWLIAEACEIAADKFDGSVPVDAVRHAGRKVAHAIQRFRPKGVTPAA